MPNNATMFSAGPWEVVDPSDYSKGLRGTGGWGICIVSIPDRLYVAKLPGRDRAKKMANGALIAAAPTMFSALVGAQRHCHACGSCDVCMAVAMASHRG